MTVRAVLGGEPVPGFLAEWAIGTIPLDEIVAVRLVDPPDDLGRCLDAIRPGGALRVVSHLPSFSDLEILMLEGGWATIVPVSPGSSIFGTKPDNGDPPPICAYDDQGLTIAEARR